MSGVVGWGLMGRWCREDGQTGRGGIVISEPYGVVRIGLTSRNRERAIHGRSGILHGVVVPVDEGKSMDPETNIYLYLRVHAETNGPLMEEPGDTARNWLYLPFRRRSDEVMALFHVDHVTHGASCHHLYTSTQVQPIQRKLDGCHTLRAA